MTETYLFGTDTRGITIKCPLVGEIELSFHGFAIKGKMYFPDLDEAISAAHSLLAHFTHESPSLT